jgi:hypothetical protein
VKRAPAASFARRGPLTPVGADLDTLACELRERLLAAAGEPDGADAVHERIEALVELEAGVLDPAARTGLVERIAERAFGLGPLEPLLADPRWRRRSPRVWRRAAGSIRPPWRSCAGAA